MTFAKTSAVSSNLQTGKRSILVGAIVAVLVAVLSLFLSNSYESVARILPVDNKNMAGLGQLAAAAATFGVNVPSAEGGEANYPDIVHSRWLLEALLKTEYQYHQDRGLGAPHTLHKKTLQAYLGATKVDQGVGKLEKILNVDRDLKTRLMTISVVTRSPDLSQQIVQQTIDLLEQFLSEKGRTRGGYKAAFAEERLKAARADMDRSEDGLRRFLDVNRNYQMSADPFIRLRGARLEMELKLSQQLVTSLTLSREQSLMEEKNDMPILNILDPADCPEQKSGPARAAMVLMAFLCAASGAFLWFNRARVLSALAAGIADPARNDKEE